LRSTATDGTLYLSRDFEDWNAERAVTGRAVRGVPAQLTQR
jgi:hypothetical protein